MSPSLLACWTVLQLPSVAIALNFQVLRRRECEHLTVRLGELGAGWRGSHCGLALKFSLSFFKCHFESVLNDQLFPTSRQLYEKEGDPNGAINSGLILQVYNRVCKPRQCFSSAHFQGSESFENYFSNPR